MKRNKLLVITGGSRGIGRATIDRFLNAGFNAINISRTPSDVPDIVNIKVDLKDIENISNAIKPLSELCQDAETICLVHNAANLFKDTVETISLTNLQNILSINLFAPICLNKLCLPFMKPGSSIIYIGSALSEMAVPGHASYIVSKHALVGLMRATSQDLASKGISTVCLCPGFVNTQLLKETINQEAIDWLLQNKVMAKRLIEPNEIAELIYTCATQPIINGEVIHANLGQIAS